MNAARPIIHTCNDRPDSEDTFTIASVALKLSVWKHLPEKPLQFEEYKTAPKLLAMGMYACFHCGRLNSVDDSHCMGCHEEKFIIRS